MNKTSVALSMSTVAFAASTAYLAYQLHLRDAGRTVADTVVTEADTRSDTSPSMGGTRGADTPAAQAHIGNPEASDAARPTGIAIAPANAVAADAQTDASTAFARQFLARYDDVNQRPLLLEELRTVIRRQYEKLKVRLNLSDSAFEQLVTLLAEEQLQAQEHWARCAGDTACDPKIPRNPNIDRTQEYQAMLGADGVEAFTQFRNSIGERDSVIQLRGRLTDSSFLPEAQAEKLIIALAEERQRFTQDAATRGAKTSGWGTSLGMLMYTEDSGLPDQYVVEASQYSQRLRTRAAEILTPAQLAAYVQMQNELLTQFTSNLRPPSRQNKSSVVRSS